PDVMGQSVAAYLRLNGHIQRVNDITPTPVPEEARALHDLTLDAGLLNLPEVADKAAFTAEMRHSQRPSVRVLSNSVQAQIDALNQKIDSELHSRGSFSLACLTLVLFGAALGILLRGQNPLAVFVVGFVPAVILVLLITAGRQLTEGNARNVTTGISLIW